MLRPLGEVVARPALFNNELGHPWTVLRATRDTDFLVLEMSARHPGNIAALARIAPPSVAVVLNVGTAHLGEFGSREARRSRPRKPNWCKQFRTGVVVLNADDPPSRRWRHRPPPGRHRRPRRERRGARRGRRARRTGPAALHPDNLQRAGRYSQLAVHGEHQVGNALSAAAVALECGATLQQVADALAAPPGVPAPDGGAHPRRRGDRGQ